MIYGPDSTAHVTIQAAEHIHRFGALVPFSVSSPLMPLWVALVAGLTGMGADRAYFLIVALVYVSGTLCFYWIVRRFQASSAAALWAALTFAVVPSRLSCLYGQPDGPRLLFWTLILVCLLAADSLRRDSDRAGWPCWSAVCFWQSGRYLARPRRWMLSAASELILLFGIACWKQVWRISLVRLACSGMFIAPSLWSFGIYPSVAYQPPAMPAAALAWVRANSDEPRSYGPVTARGLVRPHRAAIGHVIQSPGRTQESLLWLRAYATEYVISGIGKSFTRFSNACAKRVNGASTESPIPTQPRRCWYRGSAGKS